MALSAIPKLTEINTELGTTGQKETVCIANASKTGVWDRQSDFAGYTYAHFSLSLLTPFDDDGLSAQTLTITASGAWTLSEGATWINVAGGLTGTGNDTRSVTCDFLLEGSRNSTISGQLDADSDVSDSTIVEQDSGV